MNKFYHDIKKKVFIKVLDEEGKVEKELVGSKIFGDKVLTPLISKIDQKTLLVEKLVGVKSTKVDKNVLTEKIIDEIKNRKGYSFDEIDTRLTIISDVRELKHKVDNRSSLLKFLCGLETQLIEERLYPVHGDLQKQNILFDDESQLIYIDFEHFCFAPIELEFVNSLFFGDKNCLDAITIIKELNLDLEMLSSMLIFFAIKQFVDGRSLADTKSRLSGARELVKNELGLTVEVPDFSAKRIRNQSLVKFTNL